MSNKHILAGWDRNIPPASKYPIIFAGRNTHVAQILTRGLTPEEIEAHADLIAAAPDLLAACEALLTCMERDGIQNIFVTEARAAIAKAKGETP